MEKDKENIQAMIRIRPLSFKEITEGAKSCIEISSSCPNLLILDSKPEPKSFFFDYVADKSITQQDIYKIIGEPTANACLEGFYLFLVNYFILTIEKL